MAVASVTAASLFALTACSGDNKSTTSSSSNAPLVVYTALVTDNKNLNPYRAGSLNQQGLAGAIYEPLAVTNTATGKLDPWLLKSWTSNKDFTDWTLTLQSGIKWSDGKPLTSADVVFTINMLKKTPGTNYGGNLTGLTATAKDDDTVDIKLTASNPRFASQYLGSLSVASTLYILPEHIWSKVDPLTFTNYDPKTGDPVGTGPYQYTSIASDSWTLKERKNWWASGTGFQQMPKPKTLIYRTFSNTQAMAAAMTNNEVDNACGVQPNSFQTMAARNPKITSWTKELPYGFLEAFPRSLEFNTTAAPWDDPELRWAVAYIVDRNQLIQLAYAGASKPNYEVWAALPALEPTISAVKDAGLTKQIETKDVSKAQAILAQKGYTKNSSGIYAKNGVPLSLSISAFQQPDMLAIADGLTEQLRKAGIDAKTNSLPAPQFLANNVSGNFQAEVFFGGRGSVDDPWTSMNNFNVSFLNPGGKIAGNFANPWRWGTDNAKKYSAIVDKIGSMSPDNSSITGLVVDAMKYWYEDLPSIPLMQSYQICAANNAHWTGWPDSSNPYIQPTFAYDPGTSITILTKLKPAS